MKKPTWKLIAITAGLLLGCHATLTAHSVWIDSADDGRLIVRFGEFDEDFETSPGYLDSLDAVVAWTAGETNQVIQVTKNKDHFDLGKAEKKQAALVETGFPVMPSTGKPARKPYFYARWWDGQSAVEQPMLTLDLLPTGTLGEFKVLFRNQPVTDVKVTLFTPEANDKDLTTDANGIVRFDINEKGLYMLKVGRYREEREGYATGEHFGLVSHNTSLTWRQD